MTPAKPITPADDTPRGRPLVVTDSHELLDDLLRLAAAAGTTVTVAPTARAASRYWANAPLVVVGADRAAACVAANLPPRSDIVLVGTDVDDRRTWSLALLINAEHVIFLPAAETWLVNVLSRAADTASRRSLTLGVLGGHGGAGSTTLAVTLARAGLRRQVRSALLEIDPFGGLTVGPDTSWGSGLGSEASQGDGPSAGIPRFHPAGAGSAVRHAAGDDLSAAQARPPQARGPHPWARPGARRRPLTSAGAVIGDAARAEPPRPRPADDEDDEDYLEHFLAGPPMWGGDLPVLSWDRDEIPVLSPPAISAMFATARGGADLIVADLPRSADAGADVGLFLCEMVLLVVTAEPATAAAAARVARYVARTCSDVRLVVRLPPPGMLPPPGAQPPGPGRGGSPGSGSPAERNEPDESLHPAVARIVATVGLPLAGVIHHEPAANPVVMAGHDHGGTPGPEGNRPATARTSGAPRSESTVRITKRPPVEAEAAAEGSTAATEGSIAGASLIRFSDRFLAEVGLTGGAHL
ncbi:hypothetical protein CcI49_20815 [Frankia sp. CcI49]|uniref:septum site-determining protein Ssd n=1 Tax=Frankia sp. CcI49 TaxID=1745382 RepID=UPI00097878CB|nr:septum site-determining protein Ssd [Frankia sp. CcI49]ONH58658.1 hypothetical protein CcI49_20815 [Frankia sp. CcI49]